MPHLTPILLALILAALAAILFVITRPAPIPPPSTTIYGLFSFSSSAFTIANPGPDASCVLEDPWSSLKPGDPITATDPTGRIVGRTTIQHIRVNGSWNPDTAECWIRFDLPVAEAASYTIDLAGIRSFPWQPDKLVQTIS